MVKESKVKFHKMQTQHATVFRSVYRSSFKLVIDQFLMAVMAYHQWHSHQGSRGAEYPPWQRKICQESGKIKQSGTQREKEEKSGRIGNNVEGSFTLPLLTDTAGCATEYHVYTG